MYPPCFGARVGLCLTASAESLFAFLCDLALEGSVHLNRMSPSSKNPPQPFQGSQPASRNVADAQASRWMKVRGSGPLCPRGSEYPKYEYTYSTL